MRFLSFGVVLSVCALASIPTLTAQTAATYSPSYGMSQVNSNNVYPFATNPMRYQQIHDAWTFTAQTPTIVRGIRYRPSNQSFYLNQTSATVEVRIDIGLAAAGITAATRTAIFDNNFDAASRKTVFSRKKVNYPGSGATAAELAIFDISFPFDSATMLLYLPSTGRSLVVETRQYSRSGGYAFDFITTSSPDAGNGFSVQNGDFKGCPSKGNMIPGFVGDGANLKVGGAVNFKATYDAANIPAVMSLGAQKLNVALPGTQCSLMNDLLWLAPGATNANNEFTVSFPVAGGLADVRFLTQMFFFETGANALGIVASRGLENGIGRGASQATLDLARMWTHSANPDSVSVVSGSSMNGLVMMLHN